MYKNQDIILSKITRLPLPLPEFVHSESSDYYFKQIDKIIKLQHSNNECNTVHQNSHMAWLKNSSKIDDLVVFNYVSELKNIITNKLNSDHNNNLCIKVHAKITHVEWLFANEQEKYNKIYQKTVTDSGIMHYEEELENIDDTFSWEHGDDSNCFILSLFKYKNVSTDNTNYSEQIKYGYKNGNSFWIRYFSYFLIRKIREEIHSANENTLIIAAPNSKKIPFYEQINKPNERICQIISSYFDEFEYIPCHLYKLESFKRPFWGRSKEKNKKEYYEKLLKITKLSDDEPCNKPDNLILIDDVYTTGITFRAHRDILRNRYYIKNKVSLFPNEDIDIYGINIGRTQKK
tara:strand:- start:4 stop:1044 length:1041 start_codon:yes stop_codon:yes gene_type:complete